MAALVTNFPISKIGIDLSDKVLENMSTANIKKLVKEKVTKASLISLTNKIKVKGKEVIFDKLELSGYLTSDNPISNINAKRKAFEIRSSMSPLADNFHQKHKNNKCQLGYQEIENLSHIFNFVFDPYQKRDETVNFPKIFQKNINNIMNFTKIIEERIQSRKDILTFRQNLKQLT